jgi:EmrB/QacA subfamily drug resistance transporter
VTAAPPRGAAHERVEPHAWRVLAVTAAAVFVVFLDATIVNIAFPAVAAAFPGSSLAALSWVLNAYAVVFGALLVTAGRLADDHGRRKIFLLGLAVFGAASAACGLANTLTFLVAARVVQAVGAAMLVPASLALVLPEFPLARRGMAVGAWGAVGAVAAAAGPTLGALLVEGPGWRWIFYVNVPFCAVAALVAVRVLRRDAVAHAPRPADLSGVVLVTAVFGLLSLVLVQGDAWGWSSPRVIAAASLAAALVPVLLVRALHHPAPVLPVRLFAVSSFSTASAATLIFSAAFFANLLANVLFLTGVWEWSVLRTAVAVAPGPALAAVAAPLAGRLADRHGFRAVVVPGAGAFTAGQAWLALRVGAEPAYAADYLPGLVLVGLGIGLALPTLAAAGAQALPPEQYAVGSAVVSAARQLGAVLGVAGLVAVLGPSADGDALTPFRQAWTGIALVAALSAVIALALRARTPLVPTGPRA